MMRSGLRARRVIRPAKSATLAVTALAAVLPLVAMATSSEPIEETDDPRAAMVAALAGGDLEAVEGLLDDGVEPALAIIDATKRADADGLRWLFERGVVADGRPGARALLLALRAENDELAALLRAHGAHLDGVDPAGATLLMAMAGAETNQKRAYRILSGLIDSGADVNARTRTGGTALLFAAKADRFKVLRRLLAAGAEVDARDRDGWTALMLAARDGRQRTVVKLLEAGADPNAMSDAGWTALMWVAWHGHLRIAEELLEAGADPNLGSFAGGTPLVRAVQTGRRRMVLTLIAGGARADGELAGADTLEWASFGRRGYLMPALRFAG